MSKTGGTYPALYLENILTVSLESALEHADGLLERVNRENVAFIIRDEGSTVVLVPYWWHAIAVGPDPKQIMEILFGESKFAVDAEILKIEGIALGYIKLTTPETAQEILDTLLPQVADHPYANHWHRLLDKLSVYWNEEHQPELVMARFDGDRRVYLLFTDGRTRLVDMRRFIGRGLTGADLWDEEYFRDCLTLVTGALIWMEVAGEVQATFSSEELLRESDPVEGEWIRELWRSNEPGQDVVLRTT